jgi:hypothetical protein
MRHGQDADSAILYLRRRQERRPLSEDWHFQANGVPPRFAAFTADGSKVVYVATTADGQFLVVGGAETAYSSAACRARASAVRILRRAEGVDLVEAQSHPYGLLQFAAFISPAESRATLSKTSGHAGVAGVRIAPYRIRSGPCWSLSGDPCIHAPK